MGRFLVSVRWNWQINGFIKNDLDGYEDVKGT